MLCLCYGVIFEIVGIAISPNAANAANTANAYVSLQDIKPTVAAPLQTAGPQVPPIWFLTNTF